MATFSEIAKEYIDKGVEASKVAIDKTGDMVQKLGELGVLRFELEKFNGQKKKLIVNLGEEAYKILKESETSKITSSDEPFSKLLSDLKDTEQKIANHKQKIAQVELKNSKKQEK